VLRVSGEPEEALDAISHQVATNDVSRLRESQEGDTKLLTMGWGQEGGSYTARAVVPRGGPAYLMVDHCGVD
jgi:hypothetical protein